MRRVLGFIFPMCLIGWLVCFALGIQPDWVAVWTRIIIAIVALAVGAPIVKALLRGVLHE